MPDSPDYQRYLPNSTRFSLQDMGELAARMKSPVSFDRRGEVVFIESFDYGLSGWEQYLFGTGANISLISDHAYRYPYQAKLTAGTTSSKLAAIRKRLGGVVNGRLGFEFAITAGVGGTSCDFDIVVTDGINQHNASLRFLDSGYAWQIKKASLAYETIGTYNGFLGSNYIYCPIKLVFDIDLNKYIRLLLSDTEIPLTSYDLYSVANSTPPYYDTQIGRYGNGVLLSELVISHVIVTANEP